MSRLAVAGAVLVVAFCPLLTSSGCAEDAKPAKPTTANTLGHVFRDGKPISFARMWRTAPPLADGGTVSQFAGSDLGGFFFFPGVSTPFALDVFDATNPSTPQTLFEVVDLGRSYSAGDDPQRPKDFSVTLRFGALERPAPVWRARVQLRLDDDPEVTSDARARTLILASGSNFVSATSTPANPSTSAEVELAWTGTYETSARVQVLRVSGDSAPKYLAYGTADVGVIHDKQRVERRADLHRVDSVSVKVEAIAPPSFVTYVTASLDFGEASSVAVLAQDVTTTAIDFPKIPGVRARFSGRAKRDGEECSVTLPPIAVPVGDADKRAEAKLPFVAPVTITGPADGASVSFDTRFTFAMQEDPNTSAWVHELEFVPTGDIQDRLRYVLITEKTEALIPTNGELGVPVVLADAAIVGTALPLPRGSYEWTVVSRPDLHSVGEWSNEKRDSRFETIARTRRSAVTFVSAK